MSPRTPEAQRRRAAKKQLKKQRKALLEQQQAPQMPTAPAEPGLLQYRTLDDHISESQQQSQSQRLSPSAQQVDQQASYEQTMEDFNNRLRAVEQEREAFLASLPNRPHTEQQQAQNTRTDLQQANEQLANLTVEQRQAGEHNAQQPQQAESSARNKRASPEPDPEQEMLDWGLESESEDQELATAPAQTAGQPANNMTGTQRLRSEVHVPSASPVSSQQLLMTPTQAHQFSKRLKLIAFADHDTFTRDAGNTTPDWAAMLEVDCQEHGIPLDCLPRLLNADLLGKQTASAMAGWMSHNRRAPWTAFRAALEERY